MARAIRRIEAVTGRGVLKLLDSVQYQLLKSGELLKVGARRESFPSASPC